MTVHKTKTKTDSLERMGLCQKITLPVAVSVLYVVPYSFLYSDVGLVSSTKKEKFVRDKLSRNRARDIPNLRPDCGLSSI